MKLAALKDLIVKKKAPKQGTSMGILTPEASGLRVSDVKQNITANILPPLQFMTPKAKVLTRFSSEKNNTLVVAGGLSCHARLTQN